MSDAREWLVNASTSDEFAADNAFEALLAVLDLHEQRSSMGDPWCVHDNEDWPCATVRCIDKALGVTNE